MSILKYLDKIQLFILFSIFSYIVLMLLLNVSSGFDRTDESYYILVASQPSSLFSLITHEGYYTGLLYFLSGYNLANFRLLGIIILVLTSSWFAFELYRYLMYKFKYKFDKLESLLFITLLSTGSLSYYRWWLITPSYNWLTLISVILFFTIIFRISTHKEHNYDRYFSVNYLLLSFSSSLAFMAKPTTALALMVLATLFLIYEHKNINLKKIIPAVLVTTGFMVYAHILFLDGGFGPYYERLNEAMARLALLGGGHTFGSRMESLLKLIQATFFEKFYFMEISKIYIVGVFSGIVLLFTLRHKIDSLKIYTYFMQVILIVYSYFMLKNGFGSKYTLVWIRSVEILILNILLYVFAIAFIHEKKSFTYSLLKVTILAIIIIFGSCAYSFGTAIHFIHAMSSSMIFVMASVVTLNVIISRLLNANYFTLISSTILSVIIVFQLNYAYEHPYRSATNIKGQDQFVEFLGGLYVDKKQKQYIEGLKNILQKNKSTNESISLLDMTGSSPGANVILGAEFFGHPWLLGGYKGSNDLAYRILSEYKGSEKLKKTWILTAEPGIGKLDLKILNKLGLDFPNNYIELGTVETAYRSEPQKLWKPKD